MLVVESCPAEKTISRQCPFSSNLLLSPWPKGFPVLLLPKKEGRALVLQVFFQPGCTLSMDKMASLFYPVCCLHPTLGRQLGLLKFQLNGWRKSSRCGCSGLCREKDLAVQYLLTDWEMSKLKDSCSAHSECPVRTREWQDLGLYSKSTHPGAHLEFLMLCLSFHYCAESLYPEGCTRRIKRAL